MRRKSNITSIVLATSSFIGGMAVGFLFSPRSGAQNRSWLADNTSELKNWIDKQQKAASDKSGKELQEFRKNVQQGIRQNIPDLYEATEHIDLSKNDILGE